MDPAKETPVSEKRINEHFFGKTRGKHSDTSLRKTEKFYRTALPI